MLINEVSKVTGLTKKAIVYYVEQNLVVPSALENKYRDFGENDIKRLIKVSVLRKLGIGTEDIRAVLEDETGEFLRRLSVLKVLDLQKEQAKKALLDKLGSGKSYAEIAVELKTIEDSATIAQKILDAFPGYWGRFVCLHFARFLDEPIVTNIQKSAYNGIVSFPDNVPPISLPEDLEEFLSENTGHMGTEQITQMIASTKESIKNPDVFLVNNSAFLEKYLAFRQTDEYKNSPACRIQGLLKKIGSTSGYYDVFIPALKELSSSYAAYCAQMATANEKLLSIYPDI